MKAESFDKDYLPEPPTPTNKAFPTGNSRIRTILQICSIASEKSTKFITDLDSLCSVNLSSRACLSSTMSLIQTYYRSAPLCTEINPVKILALSFTNSAYSSPMSRLTPSDKKPLNLLISSKLIIRSSNALLVSWTNNRANNSGFPLY